MTSSAPGRVVAAAVCAATFVGSGVVVLVDLQLPTLSSQDPVEGLGFMVAFVACSLTAAVILLRRPTHAIGWLLATIGLLPLVAVPLERWGTYVMLTRGQPDIATTLGFWMNSWYWYLLLALVLVYLPLLYPAGRLPSRRWRYVALIPSTGVAGMVLLGMVHPTIGSQEQRSITISNPVGIAGAAHVEDSLVGTVLFLGLAVGLVAAVVAVVVRFRRSRGVERQQMKWFFLPVLVLPLNFLEALGVPEEALSLLMPLTIAAFPVAIGVAITRYRLYDLGRLVGRTVTYVVVVGVLVSLYAGAVLLLGSASRGLAGEQSDLVVAISTLLVAAAFQPLRKRVQGLVDRRFNRSRYDAARTVEAFGTRLRDEVELDAVRSELLAAAKRALQPSHGRLWLVEQRP